MLTLAAETGWSEEFILVWLPLSRAEQYYHAILRRNAWRTYVPPKEIEAQIEETEALMSEMPGLNFDTDEEAEALWKRFEGPP